jgi:hypothetical protein
MSSDGQDVVDDDPVGDEGDDDRVAATPLAAWQDDSGQWIVEFCADRVNTETETYSDPAQAARRVLTLAGLPPSVTRTLIR